MSQVVTEFTKLAGNRRPIIVVSHERSGTHFMMNTIAVCFDYISKTYVDLDQPQFNINYYNPTDLQGLILWFAIQKPANILKSHHEYGFFSSFIPTLEGYIDIIYIYRNPADVMASYWRLLHTYDFAEGPKVATVQDFATTPPTGRLMRYQMRQYDTMLDRWGNHVQYWVEAASQAKNIHIVRYEDLHHHYEDTVSNLGTALGMEPQRIEQPPRDLDVILRGDLDFVPAPGADNRETVTSLAASKFPELMSRLGYI